MILIIFGSVFIGLFLGISNNNLQLDAPTPWQLGFQDGASPSFEGIITLHDSIMFYLIWILVSVF
jgi:cytochrome c oxidase subunit 2